MIDYHIAVSTVCDPNADPVTLAAIAYEHPTLGANVAMHPRCYRGLQHWLARFGDDRARHTLATMGFNVEPLNEPSDRPAGDATDGRSGTPDDGTTGRRTGNRSGMRRGSQADVPADPPSGESSERPAGNGPLMADSAACDTVAGERDRDITDGRNRDITGQRNHDATGNRDRGITGDRDHDPTGQRSHDITNNRNHDITNNRDRDITDGRNRDITGQRNHGVIDSRSRDVIDGRNRDVADGRRSGTAGPETAVTSNPYGFTAQQALDPHTDQMTIAQIAQYAPELRAYLAVNPNTYPALLDWLAQLHDPDVDAALASRGHGA